MSPSPDDTDEAFRRQEDEEEIVEIDEYGRVYPPGHAPRNRPTKPSILRDPHGEYRARCARGPFA